MGRAVNLRGMGMLVLLVPALLLTVFVAHAVRGAHGELLQHEAMVRPRFAECGWRSDRLWQQGTRELRTEWELGGFAHAGAPVAVADGACIESLAVRCMYVRICQSP